MIKTLIVDDEPHARKKLAQFVQDDPELVLVASCQNGIEAVEAIRLQEPDLVFLDIQMPELNGFEMLAKLEPAKRPYIIFTTAYSEYAAQAFEVEAIDYLLKPFDGTRFARAVNRAKRQIVSASVDIRRQLAVNLDLDRLSDLLDQHARKPRLAVKARGKIRLLEAEEILYAQSEGDFLNVTIEGEVLRTRERMKDMQERMIKEGFVRIHRSVLINPNHVKELKPKKHGDYEFHMANGARFTSSASYRENVRLILRKQEPS